MANNQKHNLYDNRIGTTAVTARAFIDRTERAIDAECAVPEIAELAVEGYRDVAEEVFGEVI